MSVSLLRPDASAAAPTATVESQRAASPVVVVEGASKRYPTHAGEVTVLESVDLQVAPGEAVAIKGVSGSGKSTLLHLLGAVEMPSGGRVDVCGQSLHSMKPGARTAFRARHVGFVFQFFHLIPTLTALENVIAGLEPLGGPRSARQRAALDTLAAVGLADHRDHYPSQLSGGQQQRVAIARALAKRPALLLADEPTGALDEANARQVMDQIAAMKSDYRCAVVIATHDPAVARSADRVLRMEHGRLHPERDGR